ncbi:MAG: hypothetical protein Q9213_007177 [Squamulea squamosa]
MTDTKDSLLVPEYGEREKLRKRVRSGDINNDQFADELGDLSLAALTRSLKLHIPDIPSLDPNDIAGSLGNLHKSINTISPTDSEIQKEFMLAKSVQDVVDSVFDKWSKSRAIWSTHRHTLVRRWTKRTISKRKSLLLQAWPGMSPVHRPDFEVIRRNLKESVYRDALMVPHINLENLSSERNLLQFMKSRAQMYPEHFAWSDNLTFKTAVSMEAVKAPAQHSKVMLLTDQRSRETYGKLQDFTVADVEDILWTGYGVQLSQVADVDMTDEREQQSLAYTEFLELVEWQSVSKMNTQAFYRLPQPFNLDFLQRLASAQKDAAEDMFWALREDPSFFWEQVTSKFQQSLEPCRRAFGGSQSTEKTAMKTAAIRIVVDVCHDIVLWDAIDTDLKELKILRDGIGINFQLWNRLPLEYEITLESLFI